MFDVIQTLFQFQSTERYLSREVYSVSYPLRKNKIIRFPHHTKRLILATVLSQA